MGPRVFFFHMGSPKRFLRISGQFLSDAAELVIFVTCAQISQHGGSKKTSDLPNDLNRMKSFIVFVGPLVKNYPVRHSKHNEQLEIQGCSNRNALVVFIGFAVH